MKDKKIILRRPLYQYFGISFLVLSTTLFITFAIFSSFFVSRERERSEVLLRQLKHFIGFQYRPIAEEMWTENYEAILFRFSKISEQFGNAKYSIILANKDNKCVFAQSDSNPRFSCMTIGKLINLEKTRATNDSPEIVVNYDTDRKSYTAYCRLFVGDVDKGFLYAEFSDPHQLFHGSLTSFILQNFFPTLLFGFVRFGGSFGGDFMAGYGRHHSDNPQRQFTWQDTQRNLQKFTQYSSCLDFIHTDYKSTPDTTLVYADPPYAGTYLYQGRSFDHATFWSWVRQRKGPTFISELTGPDDIDIVWRKAHKSQNASNSPTTKATAQIITREERLYYKPGVSP
jgi:hypothetical protein